MATTQDAVDLARTLRSSARLRTRQPLATAWIALPDRGLDVGPDLLAILADEINVKSVVPIADDSDLVERRVKPLLPKIGKRLGSAIPAVMAAAREGAFTLADDGSVTLAGVTLAAGRGRDPGVAATGDGRGRGRRPRHGHRHRADARPSAPRATRASSSARSRTSARRRGSSSTTPSTCGWTASRPRSRSISPRWPTRRSRSSPTAPRRPTAIGRRSRSSRARRPSPCAAVRATSRLA